MNKLTKFVAFAMAATMVVGSTVTAFAEEPVTSVDTTGTGSSEGHVEKKTIDITLPTAPTDTTPFAFIMDPERLIAATAHERYANTIWPQTADDTGVYFNQGAKGGDGEDKNYVVYGSESIATTITNKSSHALDITVKAEAISADTDIPMVAQEGLANAEDASLYLGLVVGEEDPSAITKDEAAEVTVSVPGTPANYKVAWNGTDKYVYRQLTLEEYKALEGNSEKTQENYNATWATTAFNLEGAVTSGKSITAETTAPQVKVTWSWSDPEAGPTVTFANNKITVTGLGDDITVSDVILAYGTNEFSIKNNPNVTWNSTFTEGTLNQAWQDELDGQGTVTVKIKFSDDSEETATASYE